MDSEFINNLEKEYTYLIEVRTCKLKNWTDFITFTITITITLLGIAFSVENANPYLFLLPNIIIIPMTYRIRNCKYDIDLVSTYLSIVLEPQMPHRNWHTNLIAYSSTAAFKHRFLIRLGRENGVLGSTLPFLTIVTIILFFMHQDSVSMESIFVCIFIILFQLLSIRPLVRSSYNNEMIANWKKVIQAKQHMS